MAFSNVGVAADFFSSARRAIRGHTGVAATWSDNGARFNPALLGEAKTSFQMRPLELQFTVGENIVGTISDVTSHDFSSNDTNNVVSFIRKFDDKFGDQQYGQFEILPLGTRIFGFELQPFLQNSTYVELRQPGIPLFDYRATSIGGINLAYGYSFKGKLNLGFALRPTFVNEQIGSLTFTDILDLENLEREEINRSASGMGVGFDLGVIYSPTADFRLAAKIENTGGMGYLTSDGSPSVLAQRSSVGAAYRYKMSTWDINLMGDLAGLENQEGNHPIQLLQLGGELGRRLFTRDLDVGVSAGLHNGYGTYGIFADLYLIRFTVGKFTQELTRQPGVRPDPRISFSATTSFAF